MKKFIILLVLGLLALTGCCASQNPINANNVIRHALYINGYPAYYYEITNPFDGHDYYIVEIGHDMMHSPECKKCKKPESILNSSSLFDY